MMHLYTCTCRCMAKLHELRSKTESNTDKELTLQLQAFPGSEFQGSILLVKKIKLRSFDLNVKRLIDKSPLVSWIQHRTNLICCDFFR